MNSHIYPISCTRTGVPLGHLSLSVSAGHLPYLSHWNENTAYHPLFSLTQNQLIEFMKNEWNRLSKEVVNEGISDSESTNLQVGFVGLLYSLGSIQQDRGIIILPALGIVQSNLESLVALAYWQNYLDSKRFSFPEYHFSRINDNADLANVKDYLDDCWDKKAEYESGMNEVQEKERIAVAEKAILAIRNAFLRPVGKKLLWRWVRANLPEKWQPDCEGWLGTLFLGTVATSIDFDKEDIDLMEQVITSECPGGSGVMFAVRERIEEIKKGFHEHYDHFTIEEDGLSFIDSFKEPYAGTAEPQQKDFSTKGAYYVAKAKWSLANPNTLSPKTMVEIESAKSKLSGYNGNNEEEL